MSKDLLQKISAHVESLGFTVNMTRSREGDVSYKAVPQTDGKSEFSFWEYSAGVIFMAGFISTLPEPDAHPLERLQWTNGLSENFFVSRIVWVTGGGIFSEASYPKVYDNEAFNLFIARWFYEIDTALADKANVEKFLGAGLNLDA